MLVIKLYLLPHTSSNTCTVHWSLGSRICVCKHTNWLFTLHKTFLVHANVEHIMFLEHTISLTQKIKENSKLKKIFKKLYKNISHVYPEGLNF